MHGWLTREPFRRQTPHEVVAYGRLDLLMYLVLFMINAVGVTAYHSSSLSD